MTLVLELAAADALALAGSRPPRFWASSDHRSPLSHLCRSKIRFCLFRPLPPFLGLRGHKYTRTVRHIMCYSSVVKIVRTVHFRGEQQADDITEDEIALSWMRPDLERESQDHPGALVRTGAVPAGSRVTVVGRLAGETLILITTWRQ